MSESSDIYKYTQTAEYKARLAKARLKFLAEQTEMENYKRWRQESCPHLDRSGCWTFNLVHNFPDMMPRGLCPLCMKFIQPRHQDSGGPNEIITVEEHLLYPVVRWVENRDYKLAQLEQEHERIVGELLGGSNQGRRIMRAQEKYEAARMAIWDEFDAGTQQYKSAATRSVK